MADHGSAGGGSILDRLVGALRGLFGGSSVGATGDIDDDISVSTHNTRLGGPQEFTDGNEPASMSDDSDSAGFRDPAARGGTLEYADLDGPAPTTPDSRTTAARGDGEAEATPDRQSTDETAADVADPSDDEAAPDVEAAPDLEPPPDTDMTSDEGSPAPPDAPVGGGTPSSDDGADADTPLEPVGGEQSGPGSDDGVTVPSGGEPDGFSDDSEDRPEPPPVSHGVEPEWDDEQRRWEYPEPPDGPPDGARNPEWNEVDGQWEDKTWFGTKTVWDPIEEEWEGRLERLREQSDPPDAPDTGSSDAADDVRPEPPPVSNGVEPEWDDEQRRWEYPEPPDGPPDGARNPEWNEVDGQWEDKAWFGTKTVWDPIEEEWEGRLERLREQSDPPPGPEPPIDDVESDSGESEDWNWEEVLEGLPPEYQGVASLFRDRFVGMDAEEVIEALEENPTYLLGETDPSTGRPADSVGDYGGDEPPDSDAGGDPDGGTAEMNIAMGVGRFSGSTLGPGSTGVGSASDTGDLDGDSGGDEDDGTVGHSPPGTEPGPGGDAGGDLQDLMDQIGDDLGGDSPTSVSSISMGVGRFSGSTLGPGSTGVGSASDTGDLDGDSGGDEDDGTVGHSPPGTEPGPGGDAGGDLQDLMDQIGDDLGGGSPTAESAVSTDIGGRFGSHSLDLGATGPVLSQQLPEEEEPEPGIVERGQEEEEEEPMGYSLAASTTGPVLSEEMPGEEEEPLFGVVEQGMPEEEEDLGYSPDEELIELVELSPSDDDSDAHDLDE